jgi:ABC-type Fe3+-hydroxamate transport system substrate-binding protein
MRSFTDHLNRTITLKKVPERIVSLVPSQTELLFDLGLDEEVLGITKFCIHPEEWFKTKTRVGGTKNVNLDKLLKLEPDLVIANKEENTLEDIKKIEKYVPVWVSDVKTLADAQRMINDIGELVNKAENAARLNDQITDEFKKLIKPAHPKSVVYLIWNKPMMTVSPDTFIWEILTHAGFSHVRFESALRYPEITIEQIIQLKPELLFLSSEPFPFAEKHVEKFKQLLPDTSVHLVDGELFSWYGSRMLKAPSYFSNLYQIIE